MFLFDEGKQLIAVPGSAGSAGTRLCNGSLTPDLQNTNTFHDCTTKLYYEYGKELFSFYLFFNVFKNLSLFWMEQIEYIAMLEVDTSMERNTIKAGLLFWIQNTNHLTDKKMFLVEKSPGPKYKSFAK